MLECINRFKLKEGTTIELILSELNERDIPCCTNGGSYVNKNSKYVCYKRLVGDIEVNIAFPENLAEWNDFDYILVMDDEFGQPYTPFYEANHPFTFLLNVIGNYNKLLNSLSFLEKI